MPLEVRLSKKLLTRSGWRIKEYADQLFADINRFADSGLELSPTAAVHVKDAEGCLRTSVKALLVGDSSGVEHAITAGFSELKFINKLFAASTGEISYRGKSERETAAPERTEYRAKIEGLKRVLALSEDRNAERIGKHRMPQHVSMLSPIKRWLLMMCPKLAAWREPLISISIMRDKLLCRTVRRNIWTFDN